MRPVVMVRLYRAVAALLMLGSVAGFVRLWPSIGQPFGGFIWQYDNVYGHSVSYDVPRHWSGPQHGLTPHTTILAINGRPPGDFTDVYAHAHIGELVSYQIVTPNGRHRTVSAPVARFDMIDLADAYGFILLVGVMFAGGGYLLARSARDTRRMLLAFTMLAGSVSAFYHSHNGNITTFYNQPFFSAFMWAPTPAIMGALLCHTALVYPRRRRVALNHPWIIRLCYAIGLPLGLLLGFAMFFGSDPRVARIQNPALFASVGYMLLGVAATLIGGIWTLLGTHDELTKAERRQTGILAVAWCLAMAMLVGTLGAVVLRVPTPFEFLTFIGIFLPIGLVYAVINADLIEQLEAQNMQLEAQNTLRGQLLEEIRGVHQLRERILDDLANELHDTALAESKALETRLYVLSQRVTAAQLDSAALQNELARLHEQSLALGRALRLTVEGAKPVDFSSEGLLDALHRIIMQLNAGGSTRYILEYRGNVEDCPLEVKTELFWIIRAALNNVRDHATATRCGVHLVRQGPLIEATVRDDGRGLGASDAPQDVLLRRHLGISSMRTRAARLGSELQLTSQGRGTEVRVSVSTNHAITHTDTLHPAVSGT